MTNAPVPSPATDALDRPFRPRAPRWAIAALVAALVAGGVGTGCAITAMERDVATPSKADDGPASRLRRAPRRDAADAPTVPARVDAQGAEAPTPPPGGTAVDVPDPGPTARPFMHEGY